VEPVPFSRSSSSSSSSAKAGHRHGIRVPFPAHLSSAGTSVGELGLFPSPESTQDICTWYLAPWGKMLSSFKSYDSCDLYTMLGAAARKYQDRL